MILLWAINMIYIEHLEWILPKSHKMLNVIRFKQVQTHGDIHNVPQFLTAPFGFDQKLKEEKDQSC